MAFKENTQSAHAGMSFEELIYSLLEAENIEEVTTWGEHLDSVKAAQERTVPDGSSDEQMPPETDNLENGDLALMGKAVKVVDNILNGLLLGDIEIENTQELIVLLEAVEKCTRWGV